MRRRTPSSTCGERAWRVLLASGLLLPAVLAASAQPYRFHFDVLGEQHRTPSLDAYQRDLAALLAENGLAGAEVVQAFPPYVGLRVYAGKERSFNSPHHAGVVVQYGSTGGRTAYRDPDARLYLDQRVRYLAAGVVAEHTLGVPQSGFDDRRRVPFFYAQPLVEWTRVAHEERTALGDAPAETHRGTFYALQPALEVGGGLRFMQGARYVRVALGAYWRYPAVLTGTTETFHLGMSRGHLRAGPQGEKARSDGYGLRLALGLGLTR